MRLLRTLFAVTLVASMSVAMVSCDDDEPEAVETMSSLPGGGGGVETQNHFSYSAKTTVITNGVEGEYVNTESTYVIDLSDDMKTATLTINNAKFAERMPPLTMQFKGISVEPTENGYVLSSEELIPEIANTPYPGYLITGLSGNITGTDGFLNFICAGRWTVKTVFLQPAAE